MKVVGLRGEPIRDPRQPVMDVVKIAEDIAEMARAGEIKGIATAYLYWDDTAGVQQAGDLSYGVLGRLEQLKRRILDALDPK